MCREAGDRLKASSALNDLLFVTQPMHLNVIGISTGFLRQCSYIFYRREAARPLDLALQIRVFYRPTRNLNFGDFNVNSFT